MRWALPALCLFVACSAFAQTGDSRTRDEARRHALDWAQEVVDFAHHAAEIRNVLLAGEIATQPEASAETPDVRPDPSPVVTDATPVAHRSVGVDVLPEDPEGFPQASIYRRMSAFDLETVRPVFRREGYIPAYDAEGRAVCGVHVHPRDIFVEEEPFPVWFNVFHATTKEETLLTAMRLGPGDTYSNALMVDTAESLRKTLLYSTIQFLPVMSSSGACVDVVVVTRDIWSLRAGWTLDYSGGSLRELGVQFVETNLLGLNDTLGVEFILDPGTWEIGPIWDADWLGGTNLHVALSARGIVDREFGGFNGTAGTFTVERPIRRDDDVAGWFLTGTQRTATERTFRGDILVRDRVQSVDGTTWEVDRRWDETRVQLEGGYIRSFGTGVNHDLTLGGFLDFREVELNTGDETVPEDVEDLVVREYLPLAENALGPLVRYQMYRREYVDLVNLRDFAKTERYREGFEVRVDLKYSEPSFGADRRYLDMLGMAFYRSAFASDAFIELGALQAARIGAPVTDVRTEGVVRLGLPSGVAGRFVSRTFVRRLARDSRNEFFELTESNGVRGLGAVLVEGTNGFIQNIEWRSRPANVLSIRVGVAAFADIGAAWDDGARAEMVSGVGIGLRLLAPQFMTSVISLDLGFRVDRLNGWEIGSWNVPLSRPSLALRFGQLFEAATDTTLTTLEY